MNLIRIRKEGMSIDWLGLFDSQLYVLKEGTNQWKESCSTIQDLDVLAILMERFNIPIRNLSDGFVQLELWRFTTPGIQAFESGRQVFFTNVLILSEQSKINTGIHTQ